MNPQDSQIHCWAVLVSVMATTVSTSPARARRRGVAIVGVMAPAPHSDDPVSAPRPAATVIVVRGGDRELEVLLVQRTPAARFMAGAWVFPGGAVDPGEDDVAAARRELREEAAISLADDAELVPFSRWITPDREPIRFDTRFYVAALPAGTQPAVDGAECVALGWFPPAGALDAHVRGTLLLVFPTIKHLQQLARMPTADAVLADARGREVVAVRPRTVGSGQTRRVVLPGEPGYA
jgi:8-oxo-dGTP pyrophosphatase MutT (NUDIX family)